MRSLSLLLIINKTNLKLIFADDWFYDVWAFFFFPSGNAYSRLKRDRLLFEVDQLSRNKAKQQQQQHKKDFQTKFLFYISESKSN
jgi:hypothetical protein